MAQKHIGEVLKGYRERAGLELEDLADYLYETAEPAYQDVVYDQFSPENLELFEENPTHPDVVELLDKPLGENTRLPHMLKEIYMSGRIELQEEGEITFGKIDDYEWRSTIGPATEMFRKDTGAFDPDRYKLHLNAIKELRQEVHSMFKENGFSLPDVMKHQNMNKKHHNWFLYALSTADDNLQKQYNTMISVTSKENPQLLAHPKELNKMVEVVLSMGHKDVAKRLGEIRTEISDIAQEALADHKERSNFYR